MTDAPPEVIDKGFVEGESVAKGWFKCDRCWRKIEWVKARSSCGKYLCSRCFDALLSAHTEVLMELNVVICLDA